MRRFAVALLWPAAAVALAEICLRVLWPQPLYATQAGSRGWAHTPHAAFVYARPEFRARIQYNSRGFRDREYPSAKPSHTQRVLCLGDSFTEGMEVQQEQVWTEILEARFNADVDGAAAVEIINAGVPGYSLSQMSLLLHEEIDALQPDLILILHMGFFGRETGQRLAWLNEAGRVIWRPASFSPAQLAIRRALSWLRWHSHLFAAVCDTTRGLPLAAQVYDFIHWWGQAPALETDVREAADPLPLTLALLNHMQELSASRGARLLLVLGGEQARPLLPHCRGMGASCLSLVPEPGSLDAVPETYPKDGHWTPDGHRSVADRLEPWLRAHLLRY